MVKLSIIVPVYNVEKFLKKCIDSVITQKFKDFELILVNDGSSDSSGLICDEYAKKDTRIKVIHKTNAGQSSARNLGLSEAKGDYIGFVDSDDWIHEEMYDNLIKSAFGHDMDIVACNFWVMDANDNLTPYNKKPFDIKYDRDSAMNEIYTNKVLTFSPCNKIYKRELFVDLKFKEGIIFEDLDISYKLIYRSKKIAYLKECLYYYRYNINSTLKSKFTRKRLDEFHVRLDLYRFYKQKYPDLSGLVYYEFCKVRSYLFACVLSNKDLDKDEFKYLIQYDKDLLRKIMKNVDFRLKNKFEVFMFVNFPRVEVYIRSTIFKLKNMYKA